jgi:regulator of protease activity HflC (stomatin/prohibitin superfamily)
MLSITEDQSNDLIAIRYLKTLEAMADGKANKMFIPYESSGIIGSIAQVAELFKKDNKPSLE